MAQTVRIAPGEQVAPQALVFVINGVPQNLTGATLSATLRSVNLPSVAVRAATGTLVAGANLGSVTYTPTAADAVAGDYELILAGTYAGPKLSIADAIFFFVKDH